mgnify:CR=1 FL=1
MTAQPRRGGASPSGVAPSPRPWTERVADPSEPLYTVGVAADLLGTDNQTLRRLEDALERSSARPSGNQRRYSRLDLESLDSALTLMREGHPLQSIARIVALQAEIAALEADG